MRYLVSSVFFEEFRCPLKPFPKIDSWLPAELLQRLLAIQATSSLFPLFYRPVDGLYGWGELFSQFVENGGNIRFFSGADVVDPFCLLGECLCIRFYDIFHKDKVPCLFAVTTYYRLFPAEEPPGKDGNHPRLPLRILPRSIDISVAKADKRYAMDLLIVVEIVLAG